MKTLLKSLRPNSLSAQLLIIMLFSATLLQAINFYAVYSIQTSYSGEFLNVGRDSISSVYLAVRRMNDGERREYMEDLQKSRAALPKPFRFRLVNGEPAWETEDYYKSRDARDAITDVLGAVGITNPDVRARVIFGDSSEASDPVYKGYIFPFLQVMIQIEGEKWLELTHPLSITDTRLIWNQRLLILLESIIFSIVVILLIRRATRPLSKLGLAAESFGRNPENVQPLDEKGSVEVREVAQSFNKMRQRICDNLNERDRMLEAMGHDLRTPLARIQLRLEKIQPESLRDKFASNIGEIQSIIEQGIELARSLHTSEKAVPLSITALVESLVDDMEAQGEKVCLGDMPSDDDLIILARPICLKRAVENLLSNAVKYAGDARISVARNDKTVIIEIDDNGPGIPDEFLEKVFEPYYRLEGSRNRESGGTGLGLSIARNMILLHGGSVHLSNKPSGGLRARVVLPDWQSKN